MSDPLATEYITIRVRKDVHTALCSERLRLANMLDDDTYIGPPCPEGWPSLGHVILWGIWFARKVRDDLEEVAALNKMPKGRRAGRLPS